MIYVVVYNNSKISMHGWCCASYKEGEERDRGWGARLWWFFLPQARHECTWGKRDADFLLGSPTPVPKALDERDGHCQLGSHHPLSLPLSLSLSLSPQFCSFREGGYLGCNFSPVLHVRTLLGLCFFPLFLSFSLLFFIFAFLLLCYFPCPYGARSCSYFFEQVGIDSPWELSLFFRSCSLLHLLHVSGKGGQLC